MTSHNLKIASVGECMLELSRDGDAWRMKHAGDTLNTLWAMRALLPEAAQADYVSAFGTDPFSDRQVAFMAENGIGIAQSPRLDGVHPGLYAITLDGAERSFTYWRNQSAARRLADDPVRLGQSLSGRDLVYFSGITLAILDARGRENLLGALDVARRAGAKIAFDPNYRPRLWSHADEARAAFEAALRVVDIALPTFDDEAVLYGDLRPEDTAERLMGAGVREIVVKNGAEAAYLWAGQEETRVPAETVEKPLDTTGAGDSFNGGYLAGRLSGLSPLDAVRLAHRVAARTVQVYGALAPPAALKACLPIA